MALFTNTTRAHAYTAAAGQTDFAVSFPFGRGEDLVLYRNGAIVPFSLVAEVRDGSLRSSGAVRLATPAAAGDSVVVWRRTQAQQRSLQPARGPFSSADLNDELARVWMKAGDLDAEDAWLRQDLAALDTTVKAQLAALRATLATITGIDETAQEAIDRALEAVAAAIAALQGAEAASASAQEAAGRAQVAAAEARAVAEPALAVLGAALPAAQAAQNMAAAYQGAAFAPTTTFAAWLAAGSGVRALGNLAPLPGPFAREQAAPVRIDLSRDAGGTISLGGLA